MFSTLRALFGGAREAVRSDAIASDSEMIDFIATRAAHVAQTSLYGYLRARMGTRQREIFQDEHFVGPLTTARQAMLMHCLSDLVVFAASLPEVTEDQRRALARYWFVEAAGQADDALPEAVLEDGLQRFEARLSGVDWADAAEREGAFKVSSAGLIECAPVIDDLKELDGEIVRNSVRFRWTDVRRQLRERIDATAFVQGGPG